MRKISILALTGGEYDLGRIFVTPALGISHVYEISLNGKFGIGFNVTENVALTLDSNYQLNQDHDYVVSGGFAIKFE